MQKRQVLIWNEYKNWRPVVLSILRDHVDQSIFKRLREHPPRYISSGDSEWLDTIIEETKGYRPDTKALLAEGLSKRYNYLRAYHGCRPVSLDTYHTNGILPSDLSALRETAFAIFNDKDGVRKAIDDLSSGSFSYDDINRGRIFFCLTYDELVGTCGHYLLQGSEYLASIAVRISETPVLRKRGKATVFACDVPVDQIDEDTISCLAGDMLEHIGDAALKRPLGSAGSTFGFSIDVPLRPELIIETLHPTGIPNPHNYFQRED